MAAKLSPPGTAVRVVLLDAQQYAAPPVVRPQADALPELPVVMAAKLSPPGTAAGAALPVPQQYTDPVAVSPQV
jgi:hypothetical protein